MRLKGLVLAGAMLVWQAPGAMAATLVEGGYLAELFAAPAEPSPEPSAMPGFRLSLNDLALSFTPRAAFARLPHGPGSVSGDLPSLSLRLANPLPELSRLERLTITEPGLVGLGMTSDTGDAINGLVAGGALEFSSVTVGGTFMRSSVVGQETELYGADLGYGPVSARLAYGQTDAAISSEEREFWLFSTNLAARPWLSLEGDLGYTPAQATEPPSTVGRIGLRLRF